MATKEKPFSFRQDTFYGTNRSNTLSVSVRVGKRLRDIKRNHIPTAYKSRLTGPCTSWKIFYRQKDAFEYVTTSPQDLKVWAYESEVFTDQHGQRLYLAASLQQFWHYYSQLPVSQRHHYEVIPEGRHCHLYFDLEFHTKINRGKDGLHMVDIFIKFVCHHLKELYGIECSEENVLQLDASVETKFSQHLIFSLAGAAFKNNVHTGGFVEYVCSQIEDIVKFAEQEETPVDAASGDQGSFETLDSISPSTEVPKVFVSLDQLPQPPSLRGGEESIHGSCTEANIVAAQKSECTNVVNNLTVGRDEVDSVLSHSKDRKVNYTAAHLKQSSCSYPCSRTKAKSPEHSTLVTRDNHENIPPSSNSTKTKANSPEHKTLPKLLAPSQKKNVLTKNDANSILEESGLTAEELKYLFVNVKDGKQQIFCDRGVYTKNRNFRLYLSCKLGKKNPLIEAAGNTTHNGKTEEQHFLDSLVSNVKSENLSHILTWPAAEECHSSARKTPISDSQRNQTEVSVEGCSTQSPYPEIDAFVTSVITWGGRHGSIRRWVYFDQSEMIIYDIIGNRWCHNIGRPHNSNNIMIVADLRRGVYYQKCHDPDCKAANFKSQDWALPVEVLPRGILENDTDFTENCASSDNTSSSDVTNATCTQTEAICDAGLPHSEMTSDAFGPVEDSELLVGAEEVLMMEDTPDEWLLEASFAAESDMGCTSANSSSNSQWRTVTDECNDVELLKAMELYEGNACS